MASALPCIEQSPQFIQRLQKNGISVNADYDHSPPVYNFTFKKEEICTTGEIQTMRRILGKEDPAKYFNEKVLLVVGATGSGKTTTINTMINYIFGVEFKDKYRLKLINESTGQNQAHSQTPGIISYTINHQECMKIPYSLTIIDTPGFGDTRGIERDQFITSQIKEFFTNQHGPDHIDAVCFVAQASLARLTPTQRYIFDSILSLFGKDIKDNIFMMLTFADAQKPQIIDGLIESGLPTETGRCFKMNNSGIFEKSNDAADDDENGSNMINELFWNLSFSNLEKLFLRIENIKAQSLTLTQDVLKERSHLQHYIDALQDDIKSGLKTLDQLKKEKEILMIQENILQKSDYTYTVTEVEKITKPVKRGKHTSNCTKCKRTCHYPCLLKYDILRGFCGVMKVGHCIICGCSADDHENSPFIYEDKIIERVKTIEDLKQQHQKATKVKITKEVAIETVQENFNKIEQKVMHQICEVRKSIKRLNDIALKQSPLSVLSYIDMLVTTEESEQKPGWEIRVSQLKELKTKAQDLQDLQDPSYMPFKPHNM